MYLTPLMSCGFPVSTLCASCTITVSETAKCALLQFCKKSQKKGPAPTAEPVC